MIGDRNFDQLLENFGAQFETAGDGKWVYRKLQKGAPIPITPEERDRFTNEYLWRLRLTYWSMILAVVFFLAITVWWTVLDRGALPMVVLVVGLIAMVAGFAAYTIWAARAPSRELERRAPIGRERSKGEMRARFFHKMSYGQLAGAAAGAILLVLSRAFKEDLFSGWHRLWLLLAAAAVLTIGVQAFRKWRFEQENS